MRPLQASNYAVQRQGNGTFILGFENASAETRVKVSRAMAFRLAVELALYFQEEDSELGLIQEPVKSGKRKGRKT